MNVPMADKIREKYLATDYDGVIAELSHSGKMDKILNDGDAEISALIAFSYFNTGDFENALSHATRLTNYMLLNRQHDAGRDLFENSAMIVVGSLLHDKREAKAYFFIREVVPYIDMNGNVGKAIMQRLDNIRNGLAERLSNIIRYLVLIVGFTAIAGQLFFHFFSSRDYLWISLAFAVLVFFGLKWNHILTRTIRMIL